MNFRPDCGSLEVYLPHVNQKNTEFIPNIKQRLILQNSAILDHWTCNCQPASPNQHLILKDPFRSISHPYCTHVQLKRRNLVVAVSKGIVVIIQQTKQWGL